MVRVITSGEITIDGPWHFGSYQEPIFEIMEDAREDAREWKRRENAYLCLQADQNPWLWPTAESMADSHTCPSCGSYCEDQEW